MDVANLMQKLAPLAEQNRDVDLFEVLAALEIFPRKFMDDAKSMVAGNPDAVIAASFQGLLSGRSPADLLEPEEQAQAELEDEVGKIVTNTTASILRQVGSCVHCGHHQRVAALLQTPLHDEDDSP